jgi:CcmD family protein
MSFLFAAYTAIWVLLFLYIQVLSRRNRRMEKEIEELQELMKGRPAGGHS